jgi:DNA-binding NarL/FixJ family response regulator
VEGEEAMHGKTVLVVEDEINQRIPLQERLRSRGFRAEAAGTVAEAYRVIETVGEEIDVMVLDMRLDDPDDPDVTGADIGIQVRDQHPDWMPEFLISTVHSDEVNYYKLAMRLGAASYLSKRETRVTDVVRHVRALALKRSLRLGRPQVMETLSSISLSTKNLAEAIEIFCRRLLAVEFTACLGAPYILLLTDERGTQNLATNTDLPMGFAMIYATLQAMAHGISNRSLPYVVSPTELSNLPAPANDFESKTLGRLSGAALMSLAAVKNFRLSLALFEPQAGETDYPENTGQLAAVLAQYVRPTIVEHFLNILVHLEAQKKAMLKSVSYLCLYLGQDQQTILENAISSGDLNEGSHGHAKLATMAHDLWHTGTMLNSAANNKPQEAPAQFDISQLIEKVFAELKDTLFWGELAFNLEGTCRVTANPFDMTIAVKRVLQWLAQRRTETAPEQQPGINVYCSESNNAALIAFEDRSRRLPGKLREYLFEPFSTSVVLPERTSEPGPGLYLPLYLAKVLVEEKYGGWLEDKSDEMQGEIGHRLVMRFTLPTNPAENNEMNDRMRLTDKSEWN